MLFNAFFSTFIYFNGDIMYKISSYKFINNNSDDTVLFLHGWGCNISYMLPLSNIKNANALIIDLPGEGNNKPLNTSLTLLDYEKIIINFLKENNFDITYIVGHSFGSKLASVLSNKLKVKGLVLISSSIFHKVRGPRYYLKVFCYKIIKHFACFKKIYMKMGSKDYVNLSIPMKQTMSNIINFNVKSYLKEINCPTLLISSNEDDITPLSIAKRIKKYIKDCEIIMINGDHFAYLYNVAQVKAIIESLVDAT